MATNKTSAQPTSESSSKDQHKGDTKQSKQTKKRPWLKRFTWFCAIILTLGILLNGLIARKVIAHYLNQSLQDQGMSGSADINGSILSGFQIKNLHYTGNQGIQLLQIGSLSLNYQITKLSDLKIDSLKLSNIVTKIDIAKFKPSTKPTEKTNWKKTIEDLRPLITHPNIKLENINITLLKNNKKILHTNLESIHHQPESNQFHIKNWHTSDAHSLTTPIQSTTLTWNPQQLKINKLTPLPELSLTDTNINWNAKPTAHTSLNYQDATITLSASESIDLQLISGTIRSAEILHTLNKLKITIPNIHPSADININKLKLTIPANDLQKQPPHWNTTCHLGIQSARWENHFIENTNLEIHQTDLQYNLKLTTTANQAPINLNLTGTWTLPNSKTWWESTTSDLNLKTQTNQQILSLIPQLQNIPKNININQTKIHAKISSNIINQKPLAATANITLKNITIDKTPLPTIQINSTLNQSKLNLNISPTNTNINLNANLDLTSLAYQATLITNTNLKKNPWINALAETYNAPITLANTLDINWNSKGNLQQKSHSGTLTTKNLTLIQQNTTPTTLSLTTEYNWPKSLQIKSLTVAQDELLATASLHWNGTEINIPSSQLKRNGELIANIKGKIPFTININNTKKFFAQTTPWNINIKTETLRIKRITEIIPAASNLKILGTFQTKLNITGSPHTPNINGNIQLDATDNGLNLGINKISLKADLNTKNKLLNIKSTLKENTLSLITTDIQFPFTPHLWLEDNNLIETIHKSSKLKGTAKINKLPLGKFSSLIPELEKLEGTLNATAQFNGTIANPKYKINFNAQLPIVKTKNTGVDDITDIRISGTIDQNMIAKTQMNAKINGGKFTTKATINIQDPNTPVFNINILTDHALVYRDDILAMRTNANLIIKGTIENATISGNIGILESLLYKDIDLIPIGIPSSATSNISLPSLNTKAQETLPIPAPFDKWKLNLTLNTTDPILIRGNVGSGQIKGTLKVRGTLTKPTLQGTLYAQKIKAKLPFSILTIENGKIIFSPKNGFIPALDIRGKSQVGTHNLNIYAYGSATNPKTALSSYPALPENEIMTLLATGTTNSGITNTEVATFKTLQLLLHEIKQKNDRPGGNKLFSKVLSSIDKLDLKVGEINELTGEKYASATLKLHRRWYLTAQVDSDRPPQSRGLLIFALRFR